MGYLFLIAKTSPAKREDSDLVGSLLTSAQSHCSILAATQLLRPSYTETYTLHHGIQAHLHLEIPTGISFSCARFLLPSSSAYNDLNFITTHTCYYTFKRR